MGKPPSAHAAMQGSARSLCTASQNLRGQSPP